MKEITDRLGLVWSIEAAALPQFGFWVSADDRWIAYVDKQRALCVAGAPHGASTLFDLGVDLVMYFNGGDQHAFGVRETGGIWIDTTRSSPVEVPWRRRDRSGWNVNDAAFLEDRGLALFADTASSSIRVLDIDSLDERSSSHVEEGPSDQFALLASKQGFGFVSYPAGTDSELMRFSVAPEGSVLIEKDLRVENEIALRLIDDDSLVVCFGTQSGEFTVRMTDDLGDIADFPTTISWESREYSLQVGPPVALPGTTALFPASSKGARLGNLLAISMETSKILGDLTSHFGEVPKGDPVPTFVPLNGPRFIRYTGKKIELWRYTPSA